MKGFPKYHINFAKIRTPVESFRTRLPQTSYSQELSGRVNNIFSVALESPDKSSKIFSNQQTKFVGKKLLDWRF